MSNEKPTEFHIKEIQAPTPPIAPIYANVVSVIPSVDLAVLDFGFYAPSYRAPYHLEDSQFVRICLSWDAALDLAENLKSVIAERKKAESPSKSTSIKKK